MIIKNYKKYNKKHNNKYKYQNNSSRKNLKNSSKKSKKYNYNSKQQNIKLYKNDLGTKLLIAPNRNESATTSLYFYFKVGSKNETPLNNGISHFVEHLIYKGSTKFPNYLDISKTFDSYGISFNAYTSKNLTVYHYKFLSNKENLDIICKITSNMIFNPLFREKDVNTERNVIIQEYNDDIDDIDNFIDKTIEKCLFKEHPLEYPIIGNLKTINSINRNDLIEYHKKYYCSKNLLIGFSGNIHNEYINIINKYFSSSKLHKFKPISLQIQEPSTIIPFIDKHSNFEINCFSKDLNQDYIHIIFKTKGYYDPMIYHYKLIKNILGGNMSSRLFVEIREKLGLVYSIKCSLTNYEEVGYFDIYTQNDTKDTIKCIQQIFKELVKLKDYGIDKKELEQNKKNYIDLFKANFDDIEFENEYYSKKILFNMPFETLKTRFNNINNISIDELKNCSRDLFNFNKVHIITFGKIKQNTIKKIIEKFI